MKHDLVFDNVIKKYGSYQLDVTIDIPKGYVTAIVGPNGSGKTTFMNLSLGLIQPNSGEVEVFGKSILSNESVIKQKIGFVHAEDYIYPELTLNDFIQIYKDLYDDWDEPLFHQILKELDVRYVDKIGNLSTGNKKRVQAAAALAHNPDMLLLDEVFANVDLFAQKTLAKLFLNFVKDENKTIVISTNALTDVESLVDYILVLKDGKVALFDSKESLLTQHVLVKLQEKKDIELVKSVAIGFEQSKFTFSAILNNKAYQAIKDKLGEHDVALPALTDILVYAIGGRND